MSDTPFWERKDENKSQKETEPVEIKTADPKPKVEDPTPEPIIEDPKVVTPKETATQRKKRIKYRELELNDVIGMVINLNKGKLGHLNLDQSTRKNIKKNLGKKPLGGMVKGGGGMNSMVYAIAELLEASGKIYIKE